MLLNTTAQNIGNRNMITLWYKQAIVDRLDKTLRWYRRYLSKPIYNVTVYGYAMLYMYTASSKLWKMETFIKGIAEIPYIGSYAHPIGWDIAQLEILLAIGLILPRYQRTALWGSTILMGILTAYLALMMLFVPDRLCSCGGVIESMGWGTHLAFNIIWLILGIHAIRQKKYKQLNLKPWKIHKKTRARR
ncbi:MauE/DoxX family redox-associated membrane protein [Sphingobacterium luzhongxinii]|nr:MauE/DoxX family redox-associated membrane protein [Sphingobacterium sp. xlx-183]